MTLRPPAPMIAIGTGPHTLLATRGHPFWVNGQGWQMAKQLKVGAVLHGLNGAIVVDRLGEAPAREAYNLVVSDFDTYFVGDERILVHDNLPLQKPRPSCQASRSRRVLSRKNSRTGNHEK